MGPSPRAPLFLKRFEDFKNAVRRVKVLSGKPGPSAAAEIGANVMDQRDLLIKNGKILCMDGGRCADWLLTHDGKVSRLGVGDCRPEYISGTVQTIDAKGCTVLPGFIDNHFKVVRVGLEFGNVDLSPARNYEQMGQILRREAEKRSVITAYHLDSSCLEEKTFPDRRVLDRYCADKPVLIFSLDYHTIMLNTVGILYYKIPFTLPGIHTDENGILTGIFTNQAENRLESNVMDTYSYDDFDKAAALVSKIALSYGVTTVAAMECRGAQAEQAPLRTSDFLVRYKDRYPLTIEIFYQTTECKRALEQGLKHIGGALYIDGTMGGRSAALSFDYADAPHKRGWVYLTRDALTQFTMECCRHDLQIGYDAIGDMAIEAVLQALETAAETYDIPSMRHRIEHAELITPSQMERAARLGVVLCMQPGYEGLWGYPGGMYQQRLGDHYGTTNRFRRIIDSGVTVCAGSDPPLTNINPLLGIYYAVNHPVPANSATLQEALEMYTVNGAYALFLEKQKGSLREGMDADIVILDRDITQTDPQQLKEVKVDMTIKDGRVVFNRMASLC